MFFFALLVFRIGDNCVGTMESVLINQFVLKGMVRLIHEILIGMSWLTVHTNFNATIPSAFYQSV